MDEVLDTDRDRWYSDDRYDAIMTRVEDVIALADNLRNGAKPEDIEDIIDMLSDIEKF